MRHQQRPRQSNYYRPPRGVMQRSGVPRGGGSRGGASRGGVPTPHRKQTTTPSWAWFAAAVGALLLAVFVGSVVGGGDDAESSAAAVGTPAPVSSFSGAPMEMVEAGNPVTPATTELPQTPVIPRAPATSVAAVPGTRMSAAEEVAEDVAVPNVVCMNLRDAQYEILAAGARYSGSVDATGQGRRQVLERNWIVVSQTPAPGAIAAEEDVVLSVVQLGELSVCG